MKKIFCSNCFVEKGCTESDEKLIYMKPLRYPMNKLIPFYFDAGLKVLDVTTGYRKMWNENLYKGLTLDGIPYCDVTWFDGSQDSKADIIGDFRKLPFNDGEFDLIIFDPAFTNIKNAQENHGVKDTRGNRNIGQRPFYFRGINNEWIPPEQYFQETWQEFNRVSNNGLLIKISERFEKLEEIPVLTYMDLAYNNRFNSKSEFKRCCMTHYRGKRMATGARSGNPQRVLSQYVIYKKDVRKR
jgi:hypothetical protein